jgi:drug/metabolite transporter (DMT)-like permease
MLRHISENFPHEVDAGADKPIMAPHPAAGSFMQYLYPLLTVMIWAGNNVITKAAAGRIFPAEIGFYRWLLAGLLFTPFLLGTVLRNRAAIKPIMGKVVVLGVLGMAIYQSLAYYAANITTATNMGIILSLVPVMTLGMSIASLGTALTAGALVGALVSFAGVLLVVSQGSWAVLIAHGVNLGDLMMLVAALAYATYSTLLKKWQLRMPPLQLLYLQILVAIIALFLISQKTGLSTSNIPLVLYACIPTSMIAPLLWMKAIGILGPSRTTLFFNLVPILTALVAALALGEQLAAYHFIGGALTLTGVLLAERWTTPLRKKTTRREA